MQKLKIGQIIHKARKKKGLTLIELGKIIGVSHAAISGWENDKGYPRMEKLLKIITSLEIRGVDVLSEDTITGKIDGLTSAFEIKDGGYQEEKMVTIPLSMFQTLWSFYELNNK